MKNKKIKFKRIIQAPNSYFMDIKCMNCQKVQMIFSHAQSTILCENCSAILCKPSGGKAQITPGCAFKIKN
ncbi:hypothetical protein IMG5_183360 [Ichthyophthirius multifiliis]|uniref:40S ribosomal protein S27 n=1 Tax=Ichthyophthirius multifiliis TaxID=5932 RepID=G0R356_ICHMU|nr:hypothetical protein IMG5_183360 [Ichthyophthirius multifiliis]EGR28079.1 hypothetical protein IMG5_183360 [Ichthyophthirius multifiliis]|eukprot:XP_004027424.1 hypothetical protein IMG5_183360 [Ichthyophthirius multifiliis]